MQEKLEKLATRTQEAAPATTPTPAPASAVAAEMPRPWRNRPPSNRSRMFLEQSNLTVLPTLTMGVHQTRHYPSTFLLEAQTPFTLATSIVL